MIKAVIFDMDGVIIDSEMAHLKRDLNFARSKNPAVRIEQLYAMVGSARKDSWNYMAEAIDNGQTWQELRDEFHVAMKKYPPVNYRQIYRREVTGILEKLKEYGLKIALASSTQKEAILRILEDNAISDYFQVVVSGEQFQRSKPDPEIYHYTARALDVLEEECFVVEDSTYGITAANRAGMRVAALVDERFGFDQSLADYRIENLTELLSLIEEETCQ